MTIRKWNPPKWSADPSESQVLHTLLQQQVQKDLENLCKQKGCSLTEEQLADMAEYFLLEGQKHYENLLQETLQKQIWQGRPASYSTQVSEILFLLTVEERLPAYQYLLEKRVQKALVHYLDATTQILSSDAIQHAVSFAVSGPARDPDRSLYENLEQAVQLALDPQEQAPKLVKESYPALVFLLDAAGEKEQLELFSILREPLVKQDVLTRMKTRKQTYLEYLADRATELYVWDQVYDNNISYWENLDHAIGLAIWPELPVSLDRGEKKFRKKPEPKGEE